MINQDLGRSLNKYIHRVVSDAIKISIENPKRLFFFINVYRKQKKSMRKRIRNSSEGIDIPPALILSVTESCNLRCKGCYSNIHKRNAREMSIDRINELLSESESLGISFVLLAGGEPMLKKGIIETAAKHKNIIFLLFTNGMLLNDENIKILSKAQNIIPVISLEGGENDTDERRGAGIYKKVIANTEILNRKGVFFGASITVTGDNFQTVTDEIFINGLINKGYRLFFFVEYVPVDESSADIIISEEQRDKLNLIVEDFRQRMPGLFISFPGDEKKFGGCLAAGRGFLHVSSDGNVEPCPFAPYSDRNLAENSLKNALDSEFLAEIRKNHDKLTGTVGGCALWENRQWARSILDNPRDI